MFIQNWRKALHNSKNAETEIKRLFVCSVSYPTDRRGRRTRTSTHPQAYSIWILYEAERPLKDIKGETRKCWSYKLLRHSTKTLYNSFKKRKFSRSSDVSTFYVEVISSVCLRQCICCFNCCNLVFQLNTKTIRLVTKTIYLNQIHFCRNIYCFFL